MKKIKLLMLFLTVSTAVFAQETIKMKVKENKAPCMGVGPMECLQVKIGKEKNWGNFYSSIDGFNYEPGYEYKLKVEKTKRQGIIPADASAFTYKLKKVVCKKKAKSINNKAEAMNYLDKKMVLTQLNGKSITKGKIYTTLNSTNNSMSGKSGCNNFGASFKLKEEHIEIERGMGTMMACDPETMQLENDFLKALEQKHFSIGIEGTSVTFYNTKKNPVLVFEIPTEKDIWSFIDGKKWKLFQMDHIGKDYEGVFIQFDEKNKKVHGNTGCNNFFGTFSTMENVITFSGLGTTRMACMDDDKKQTEKRIIEILSDKSVSFDVADQTLNFYVDDKLIMMYGLITE